MKTLAIFSPAQNIYSETFIRAHKNLPLIIKFYYGGFIPTILEGRTDILGVTFRERLKRRFLKGYSFQEKRLIFSLRNEKVNCVLAEYGITGSESLNVVRYLKLPLIVHFHGYDASDEVVIKKYKKKYLELFEYAAKVIVVSKKMKKQLLYFGCPEFKIVLNPYGPENSFFNIKPEYKKKQFISVGRFVNKKAPQNTILAFKKVVDQYPTAKLIMVGEGELLNFCKSIIKPLKLENNIEFKGVCKPDEIKILFENSLAFVQHSVIANNGDSEGTPVAILEAQASGLPVISTYHAGIPDIVINNETGLLVEEHDIDGMAVNMIRILEENGLAKKLGEAGRKRISENFTMDKHLAIIKSLVEELTAN